MNRKQYEQFQKSIRQCQEKSQKTLNSIDKTLLDVKQTLTDIQQTHDNIDKIKQQFGNVMDKLAHKIAKTFISNDTPFKKIEGVTYNDLPKQISEKQVIPQILKYKKVLILTGAGVSVDSGIPTFRGKGGLYSKKFQYNGISYQPQQFITLLNYKMNPQGIWNWLNEIYNLSYNTKPNQVHKQINKLAKKLKKKGLQVVLITQNIDDLHIRPQNNQYQYFMIHGNCKYVRCDNHHFILYTQNRKNELCSICNQKYRPHILFFDQSYGKDYGLEVKDRQFPFVITIGSSLKTGLAINMIKRAQQVIQINPQPVIEYGKIYRFTKSTIQTLKNLNNLLN